MNMEYKTIFKSESFGRYGGFGIEILVASTKMPNLKSDAITTATYKAAGLVSAEVQAAIVADNQEAMTQAKVEKQQLLALFPEKIFVEEIPNGYCHDWCCRHLPWFIVTTEIGHFKIGWRKRVIQIEWDKTIGTKTAEKLFPDESVTKGKKYIHAWNLEDAKKYISIIITSANKIQS